jgi:RNA polymerase sigma-70 factor, ECF subfamily
VLPQARALAAEDAEARKLLGVLVRNVARNMRRRHHRAAPHQALADVAELAADEPSVEELVRRAEEHVRLLGCVNRLAELERRVVRLRMLDQVSGLEAARELDIQPGRVAVLLHRAKKALLACLVA